MKARTKKIASLATVVLLVLTALLTAFQAASVPAYAAASAFDDTYVLDDLECATLNGKAFDLADYPYDKKGEPQIISFTEFGYSDTAKDYYALYVYLYNPQDFEFADTLRNHVQFTFGGKETYEKYSLQLCNYSTRAGYERRFYKFKVQLSANDVAEIYAEVNKAARVYKVSGVELTVDGTVTEYKCAQEYTYKGFAKGFSTNEESTLTCEVNGIDKYLELSVYHTYYRPDGSNGKNRYTHDSLNSIYFAIPKEIDEEYGVMTRIRGEYLKALTTDIFVTGNDEYYKELAAMVGVDIGFLVPKSGDFDVVIGGVAKRILNDGKLCDWAYNWPENEVKEGLNYFSRLNYVIKAQNGDADSYNVSSEELAEYMEWYTMRGPGKSDKLILDRYASSLFEWVDDEMTHFDISSDDFTQSLTSKIITQNWWQKITGQTSSSTYYEAEKLKAIHTVTEDDFVYYPGTYTLNEEATSKRLYVAEENLADLKNFYDRYSENNVIYLVRFSVDDYASTEAVEGRYDDLMTDTGKVLIPGYTFAVNPQDTNCYLAQEYVYLAFDIIDLTLTKNNVSTVMAVVISPIDIIPGLSHPSQTTPDPEGFTLEWWHIAIIVAVLIIIVIIVYYIITAPWRRQNQKQQPVVIVMQQGPPKEEAPKRMTRVVTRPAKPAKLELKPNLKKGKAAAKKATTASKSKKKSTAKRTKKSKKGS